MNASQHDYKVRSVTAVKQHKRRREHDLQRRIANGERYDRKF